ncbi:probable auxin efflux carrier component 5a isoform X2 [Ricinus communis]|uniref:probable auxin efflux carrier component 5a isoform X2 n=1 Tax=Ricinus communis TaxID=3988 RepID=UPI000D690FAC|nr:probable auxin efflux carrier component 5a isoform X2 [Ricinus communis]|eukprot:XP_025011938.1 probable auxin efflux carrier component 5a isoform X2 [Ricinus communis]
MIGWEDVYKVIVAMVPLYVALLLGYGSIRWWKIFTPEQGGAVNRLVCYFTLPLFTFEFTAHVDPFKMNYLFIGADAISKFIIVVVLACWAKFSSKGSYTWWHFEMPSIMEGSILIMSKAGTGTAMFSMGIFMAVQEKVIACGAGLTVVGMILRFIAGPAAMAIGSIAVGLHGDVLRVAIIQAALPQSITSFIFAKEYGLHAEVLSTAVIFGMIVSLPVLIAYYAILEFAH